MYALIENNQVSKYPYSFSQLRKDNPNVSYPRNPSDEVLENFGVYKVNPSAQPNHDPDTQNVTEGTPELVDAVWSQTWIVSDATAEEITERTESLKRQINNERNRRINLPKSVSLISGKSFTVDMSNGGRQNIGDLGTAALAKASINDTSTISFRDADNTDWDLTNEDIIEMGLQVTSQVSALHVKAREIKAMDPLPRDYTDNLYWS